MLEYNDGEANELSSTANFLHLEKFQSTCFTQFGDLKEAKFATAFDKVFIITKGKFFILTNSDIFTQDEHFIPKDQVIMYKALDVYCPIDSTQVVIYGIEKNGADKQNCIVIYNHVSNLLVCKFYIQKGKNINNNDVNNSYTNLKPLSVRAKLGLDHSMSHVAIVYQSSILLYHGPFASRKIDTPEEISTLNDQKNVNSGFDIEKSLSYDTNNNSILLLEFGKIKINGKMTNVIFLLKKKESSVFNLLILAPSSDLGYNESKKTKILASNIFFSELITVSTLLSLNSICLAIRREGKTIIRICEISIDENDQGICLTKLELVQNEEVITLNCFNHHFCTFSDPKKSQIFNVYDYKYVRDPTIEELEEITNNQNQLNDSLSAVRFKKKLNLRSAKQLQLQQHHQLQQHQFGRSFNIRHHKQIVSVFRSRITSDAKIMFCYMKRMYLLNDFQIQVLYEDDLPQIIDKLVSSTKYFEYAKALAKMSLSKSAIADIEWKQANYLFKNQQLTLSARIERAMDHFIHTIGYKSPSDVIQLYMDNNDQALIRYLWGDNEDEPSEASLIMHPLPGRTEHRRLLISICVMRYSECKTQMDEADLINCPPMKILKYLANNKEYNDCWDSLITAFLSIGHRELATELAKSSNNYEQVIRIIFDQGLSGGYRRLEDTQNYIKKLINEKEFPKERKMKILNEYARELFCIQKSREFVSSIAQFTVSLILDSSDEKTNYNYIKEICLLFLPQKNSDDDSNFSMNELFVSFFQEVTNLIKEIKKSDNKTVDDLVPRVMNDVYIQHLLSLSMNNEHYINELKDALKYKKYTVDVTILSILDLPDDKKHYKFQLFEVIYKTHKEYSSHLIHLIVVSKDFDEDHPEAILGLCKVFGKEEPRIFIEAIAEFVRTDQYIDMIPKLLDMSKEVVPLPDMINFLLQLDKSTSKSRNSKLLVKHVKPYLLEWINEMMAYHEKLDKTLKKNQEEFAKLHDPNTRLTKEEMKEVRIEYKKMVLSAAENKDPYDPNRDDVNSDDDEHQGEIRRPFSTLPMQTPLTKSFTYGSCLPKCLTREIAAGILFDGMDMVNGKVGQPFTEESQKMLAEFDELFEKVQHYH